MTTDRAQTDYPMRDPTRAELIERFGSLQACVAATGGDLPTILFLLANPDYPMPASKGNDESQWAVKLREDARAEHRRERDAAIVAAWREQDRKSVNAIMRDLCHSRETVDAALLAAGVRRG